MAESRPVTFANASFTDVIVAFDDLEQNDNREGPESSDSETNQDSEASFVDSSTANPTGVTTDAELEQKENSTRLAIETKEIHSFLKLKNQRNASCSRCTINKSEDIAIQDYNRFKNISSIKCKKCDEIVKANPWWMFGKYADAKEDIFRFLRYNNATKTLCCKENCKANDKTSIVPVERDNFGIVSSVGCIKCGAVRPLRINTVNRNNLTVIEKANDLKPGDEIMFRRWYGISHHAIYLGEKESKKDHVYLGGKESKDNNSPNERSSLVGNESSGCCSGFSKCFKSSKVLIPVISPTFDVEDARVIKTDDPLEGFDVYRVEYDNCYPPQWAVGNARSAANFATACKELGNGNHESNYDPFLENCEHFARRCKTGQSESRQVQACLFNCGTNIAMLALRVAFVAIWLIFQIIVVAYEKACIDYNVTVNPDETKTGMRVAVGALLCIVFMTLKVVLSLIQVCRKMTRPHEPSVDKKEPKLGKCGTSCYRCCCKCCPRPCFCLRYLCRLFFCLVPIRLCKKCFCSGCCSDRILKFCCRHYLVITLRVVVGEVIVMGIPVGLALAVSYEWDGEWSVTYEFVFEFILTLSLIFILSVLQSCITNILGLAICWCCRRCCNSCCCSCKNQANLEILVYP